MSSSRAARQKRAALAIKVGSRLHAGVRRTREHLLPLLSVLLAQKDPAQGTRIVRALELEPADVALLLGTKEDTKKVQRFFEGVEPDVVTERVKGPAGAGPPPKKGAKKRKSDPAEDAPPPAPAAAADEDEAGTGKETKQQKGLFEF